MSLNAAMKDLIRFDKRRIVGSRFHIAFDIFGFQDI